MIAKGVTPSEVATAAIFPERPAGQAIATRDVHPVARPVLGLSKGRSMHTG